MGRTTTILLSAALLSTTALMLVPTGKATHSCPGGYPSLCVMDGHEDGETWRNRVLTVSQGLGSPGVGYLLVRGWASQYETERPGWHYQSTFLLASLSAGVSGADTYSHTFVRGDQTAFDRDGGEPDHERTTATVQTDHRVGDRELEIRLVYSQIDLKDEQGCIERVYLQVTTPEGTTEATYLWEEPCTVVIPQLIASGYRVPITEVPPG